MQIEYINRESLYELQNTRFISTFKKLINVRYYKEKLNLHGVEIDNIKTIKDIAKLPFTTKEDLMGCYPTNANACDITKIVKYHFTSGTTGKPLAIAYTQNDIDAMADCLDRLLIAAGVTKESVVQNSYGYGLFSGGLSFHEAILKIGATVIPSSVGNDERQIELLKDFNVDTLCATPSYVLHLANKIRADKVSGLSLKRCICGAETWSENMKAAIENMLNVEAYDVYGMTELGVGLGYNCQFRDGIHVCEDMFYVEIIDQNSGEVIEDERVGELVITSLNKEGLPLIRYKTGDLTHFILEPCKCGRTHRRIARIIGRADDMMIVKGINIYPSKIESFINSVDELKGNNFEIVVKTEDFLDDLTLRIEADDGLIGSKSFKEKIEKLFIQQFGIKATVELIQRFTLPRETGKKRYVKDLRKK